MNIHRACLRAALLGGAAAGPVAACMGLASALYTLLTQAETGVVAALAGVAVLLAVGSVVGMLVALVTAYPLLVLLAAGGWASTRVISSFGIVVGAAVCQFLLSVGPGVVNVMLGALIGLACAHVAARSLRQGPRENERSSVPAREGSA